MWTTDIGRLTGYGKVATDTYLTLSEIGVLFQSLTMSILGLDPTNWNAYSASPSTWIGAVPANPYYNVRLAWPTEGAPAWKITEDVVFLQCIEIDDSYNRQRETSFDLSNSNQATSYTRVIQVSFIIYGPNSFDNARKIKDSIFYQQNHDTLASNNLYMIPDIIAAMRSPELFEGQWWERVTMNMSFNEFIVSNTSVLSIESAVITVIESSTQQQIITIT